MNRSALREFSVFVLLLTLAVVGRWAQPAWHFTPLVAVTAWGGFYFRHWLPAVLLPVAALLISDLALPAHDNMAVMATVHVMMVLPLLLGRMARKGSPRRQAICWGACGFVPATLFFLVTNLAVWGLQSTYPSTWAGLMSCYAAGVPFYRTMLAGDLFYMTALAGCWLAAGSSAASLLRTGRRAPLQQALAAQDSSR